MSPRALKPKSRIYLVVLVLLVVLVVLVILIEVTKICQILRSCKIGLGLFQNRFSTPESNKNYERLLSKL